MAKDDYFVLVYRILAYLYYCVKEGVKPDMTYLTYNTEHFPICESYWEYIIENILLFQIINYFYQFTYILRFIYNICNRMQSHCIIFIQIQIMIYFHIVNKTINT